MHPAVRIFVALLVLGALFSGARGSLPLAKGSDPKLTDAQRAGTFTYGPTVSAYDRQLIEAAVTSAHPAAQRLIAEIDGLTTVQVGPPDGGAAGLASGNANGFAVTLDLAAVSRHLGPRGVNRLVLHELGHVVDFLLVPEAMKRQLDAGVPQCLGGAQPGCTDPAERFAESFAKWAMADIGVNLYIGYSVPPPGNLETWAAPLSQLVR